AHDRSLDMSKIPAVPDACLVGWTAAGKVEREPLGSLVSDRTTPGGLEKCRGRVALDRGRRAAGRIHRPKRKTAGGLPPRRSRLQRTTDQRQLSRKPRR